MIPVASVAWSGTFNAGYDSDLDTTAVELPYSEGELSLILMFPGKISEFVTGLWIIDHHLTTLNFFIQEDYHVWRTI